MEPSEADFHARGGASGAVEDRGRTVADLTNCCSNGRRAGGLLGARAARPHRLAAPGRAITTDPPCIPMSGFFGAEGRT